MRVIPVSLSPILAVSLALGCADDPSSEGNGEAGETGTAGEDGTTDESGDDSTDVDTGDSDTGEPCDENGEWIPPLLEWEPCGEFGECAIMDVPLDWADPCGPTTPLSLRRIAAANPRERIGAILVNPGGPGAGGTGTATFVWFWVGDDIRDRFDIVGWDPRGTDDSAEIDCGFDGDLLRDGDVSPDDADELAELRVRQQSFADACGENAGPLLGHVSTDESIQDMDAIRRTLGDDTISYMGYSYGTQLGARYADRYPDRVRAFILDGAVDPSLGFADSVVDQAAGFEQALTAFLDDCAGDPGCAFHNAGDPYTAYDELFAEIELAPIDDLEPADAEVGVVGSLYSSGKWPELAEALADAQAGDGVPLFVLADGYSGNSIFDPYASIKCLDEPAPSLAEFEAMDAEIELASPRIGRSLSYEYQFCSYWPVEATGVVGPTGASGAPPIVVIGTTGDPATPYSWAVSLADQLESGRLLTYDGEGHTVAGKGIDCVDDAARAYLLDLTVPAEGTVCP